MRIIFAQRLRYLRIVERILREFPRVGRAAPAPGISALMLRKSRIFPVKRGAQKNLKKVKKSI